MGQSLNQSWVTADGEYGEGAFITFDPDEVTEEQWDRLVEMSDGSRYDYVSAILDFDDKLVREIERNNFGEEWGL